MNSINQDTHCFYTLNSIRSPLYTSVNETLDFKGLRNNQIVRFDLTRTKVSFNIYLDNERMYNLGGELIDVSIPYRSESKLINLFDHGYQNSINK